MSRNPEQQLHGESNDLVRQQKEQRRDHDEDEDYAGGDHGLAPGRPGDLGHLGSDFADKFDRISRRHDRHSSNNGRSGGTRTHDPRFWRPMLYQLSYTPVPPRDLYARGSAFKGGGRRFEPRW